MATRKIISQSQQQALGRVRNLLDSQRVAVLATQDQGQPYCSLVAIAATADLKSIMFPTLRATHKFANLSADPRASLMIDDRTNDVEDLDRATGITAIGTVDEIAKTSRSRLLKRFLAHHPELTDFTNSPDCALMRVKVDRYVVVTQFQQVVEISCS